MEHDDPLDLEGAAQAPADPDDAAEDSVDWAAVERDFIHSGLSQERIAKRHGTSRTRLARYAQQGGWVRLVPLKPLPVGPKPRPPGAPKPARGIRERRLAKMARRLFRVLDARLTEIEERMAKAGANGEASAADAERDMRSLSALARLYAKLVELDEAARKADAGKGSDTPATPRSDDADHFRRDLALRLQRLDRAADA